LVKTCQKLNIYETVIGSKYEKHWVSKQSETHYSVTACHCSQTLQWQADTLQWQADTLHCVSLQWETVVDGTVTRSLPFANVKLGWELETNKIISTQNLILNHFISGHFIFLTLIRMFFGFKGRRGGGQKSMLVRRKGAGRHLLFPIKFSISNFLFFTE